MRRLNQKGFSIVEGLLIVVIIGIIGGAGYFVMKASKNVDKTNAATDKSSLTTPSKSSKTNKSDPSAAVKIVPDEPVYVNVIQDDGTVTNESPNKIAKTADQVAILKALHSLCTTADGSYVTVNHAVFDGGTNFKQDGNYAEINAGRCAVPAKTLDEVGGSGAATYLHKDSKGVWIYDFASQMGLNCKDVDGKGYPTSIIAKCYDGVTSESTRAPK